MKRCVRTMQPRNGGYRSSASNADGGFRAWLAGMAVMAAVIVFALFGAFNLRTHYSQEAQQFGRDARRISARISELEKSNENNRIKKEILCSYANVSRRSAYLGLRPASSGQIRKIAIVRASDRGARTVKRTASSSSGVRNTSVRRTAAYSR